VGRRLAQRGNHLVSDAAHSRGDGLDRRNYENAIRNAPTASWTILHTQQEVPWAGFSSTGYTKGELFLRTLEDELGRSTLDTFLRAYFAKHAMRWTSDQTFLALLREMAGSAAVERALVNEWIYSAGLPANVRAGNNAAIYERVLARVASFSNGASMASLSPQTWLDAETDLFLQQLSRTVFRNRASEIDTALGLSTRNAPPTSFLLAAIATDYAPANAGIERVLMRGGANNTIITIYNALAATPAGRQRASEIFSRARERYHPSVVEQVQRALM
jgi:hypothetical protein